MITIGKVSQNESIGHRPGLRHCGMGRGGLRGKPLCTGGFWRSVYRRRRAVRAAAGRGICGRQRGHRADAAGGAGD